MKKYLIISLTITICHFSCKTIENDLSTKSPTENNDTREQVDEKIEDATAESYPIDEAYANKAIIGADGSIWLQSDMKKDHRIFAYASPSTDAQKLFLLSIFTDEVEGNPFDCVYGSYYETLGMNQESITIEYLSDTLNFSKIAILQEATFMQYAYVEKKWLEFEKN